MRVDNAEWTKDRQLLRSIAEEVGRDAPALLGKALLVGALELSTSALEDVRFELERNKISTTDVRRTLVDLIYRRTPPPGVLDVLVSAMRSESARLRSAPRRDRGKASVRLSVRERETLRGLLTRYYGGRLASFAERRFSVALEAISFAQDESTSTSDLIRTAERDGWLNEILISLAHDRFSDAEVLLFLDSIGFEPTLRPTPSMPERELRAFLGEYRGKLGALEARTCSISVPLDQRGCAPLVGSDTVITVASALRDVKAEDLVFRFDRVVRKGKALEAGTVHRAQPRQSLRDENGGVTIVLDSALALQRIDPSSTDPSVAPRGAVAPVRRDIEPGEPIFWLSREVSGTVLSGVRQKSYPLLPDGRIILESPPIPQAIGCACVDGAMNVIGLYGGGLENDSKRSTMLLLKDVLRTSDAPSPAAVDPFGLLYAADVPLINRAELRALLRKMVDGPLRILHVDGPPGSGKSYTANFVRRVADAEGDKLVFVDISGYGADRDVNAEDLYSAIADLLDLRLPTWPPGVQLERRLVMFFDWLAATAGPDRYRRIWFIFDGFRGPLPLSVSDFITEFLLRIGGPLGHFRCVLLGYPENMPAEVEPIVGYERIGPLSREDFEEFFHKLASEHPGLVQDQPSSSFVRDTMAKLDADGAEKSTRDMIYAVRRLLRTFEL